MLLPNCNCCGIPCTLCTSGALPATVTVTLSEFTGCLADFNGQSFVLRPYDDCTYRLQTTVGACTQVKIDAFFHYNGPTTKASASFSAGWRDPDTGNFSTSSDTNCYATATSDVTDCGSLNVECSNNNTTIGGKLTVVGGGEYAGHTGVLFPAGCKQNLIITVEYKQLKMVLDADGAVVVGACESDEPGYSGGSLYDCGDTGGYYYPRASLAHYYSYPYTSYDPCSDDNHYELFFDLFGTISPCNGWKISVVAYHLELPEDLYAESTSPTLGSDMMPSGVITMTKTLGNGDIGDLTVTFDRVFP